jgi:hypothetical protein
MLGRDIIQSTDLTITGQSMLSDFLCIKGITSYKVLMQNTQTEQSTFLILYVLSMKQKFNLSSQTDMHWNVITKDSQSPSCFKISWVLKHAGDCVSLVFTFQCKKGWFNKLNAVILQVRNIYSHTCKINKNNKATTNVGPDMWILHQHNVPLHMAFWIHSFWPEKKNQHWNSHTNEFTACYAIFHILVTEYQNKRIPFCNIWTFRVVCWKNWFPPMFVFWRCPHPL